MAGTRDCVARSPSLMLRMAGIEMAGRGWGEGLPDDSREKPFQPLV